MRLARDFGTVSELLPDGVDDIRDCPHHLFEGIRSALVVLSFDELPKDERPPKRIWNDGEALSGWFENVSAKREREAKGQEIEDPVDNAAAEALLVG